MTRIKATRIILALCLVAVVGVGSTLAYLTYVTPAPTVNMFTFGDGITGTIEEPSFPTDPGGVKILPGAEILKDPQILNTTPSGGSSVYAAIKLEFTKPDGTVLTQAEYDSLIPLLTINFDTAKWALVKSGEGTAPVQVWYYKTAVLAGAPAVTGSRTDPLFTKVTINDVNTTIFNAAKTAAGNGFNIKVSGAIVQADVFATEADPAQAAAVDPDTGLYALLTGTNPVTTP